MRKILIVIVVVLILNAIVISSCVRSGQRKGDIMLRFRERQAVTFLSALMLGIISMISLVIYFLKKKLIPPDKGRRFWLFSSIGFFYLCMDEYFMAHEGMDEAIGSLFGKYIKDWNLDGVVLAVFGLIALGICLYFRRELLKHKQILPFLLLGGICLAGTVVFHILERIDIILEVVEESFKIVGVSFFFAGFFTVLTSFLKRLSIQYN